MRDRTGMVPPAYERVLGASCAVGSEPGINDFQSGQVTGDIRQDTGELGVSILAQPTRHDEGASVARDRDGGRGFLHRSDHASEY